MNGENGEREEFSQESEEPWTVRRILRAFRTFISETWSGPEEEPVYQDEQTEGIPRVEMKAFNRETPTLMTQPDQSFALLLQMAEERLEEATILFNPDQALEFFADASRNPEAQRNTVFWKRCAEVLNQLGKNDDLRIVVPEQGIIDQLIDQFVEDDETVEALELLEAMFSIPSTKSNSDFCKNFIEFLASIGEYERARERFKQMDTKVQNDGEVLDKVYPLFNDSTEVAEFLAGCGIEI